jgi:hypothetical protein
MGIVLGVILLQFVAALATPGGLTAPSPCSTAGCDAMAITKGVDFGLEDACLEDDCPRSDGP